MPIIEVNGSTQYENDYREYALYSERHRATPEFRDGLKPVQRRIIYASYHNSQAVKSLTKSATIVGDTMGRYHPHGDSSIEGALYTMTNWYQTKVPLFIGQGNFGNTFENSPAASRYTEVRLSDFAYECLIEELVKCKQVVDTSETYNNSSTEPMFLPAKLPLLLINGCSAISVGSRVGVPSHNINEVIDQTISLIKNPNHTVVLVPDHCQKCDIVDTDWVSISKKGFGNYKVRGRIDIETYNGMRRKYKDHKCLVIKSCPNLTFLDSVVSKVKELVASNKLIGIEDEEEQSSENNMRYVFILKTGVDPEYVRSEIFKKTAMQTTDYVNLKVYDVWDENVPTKRVSYTGYINAWIQFRKLTKYRYYANKQVEVATRLNTIEMFIWAIESGKVDEALKIIRNQKTIDDNAVIESLIKKLNINDIQAEFFINSETKKLSKGYLEKFSEEAKRLREEINKYHEILTVEGSIENIIIEELLQIKKKYGCPRTCNIVSENEINGIPAGTFKVIVTETNYIKKVGIEDKVSAKDPIRFVFNEDNNSNLLFFDNIGRVYNIPMSKIPFADKNSNGVDLRIINKYLNAPVKTIISENVIKSFVEGYMVILTKKGFIKKLIIKDFLSVAFSGLVYSKLDQGDTIVDILLINNLNYDIVVYSTNKAIRIPLQNIPTLKRNTKGNCSMSNVDSVEGLSIIKHEATDIVVVTSKGYFNRLILDTVPTSKTKRGSNVIKLSKGDSIVSVLGVSSNDIIGCIGGALGEAFKIPVSDIPNGSSISTGVRIIPAKSGPVVKVTI